MEQNALEILSLNSSSSIANTDSNKTNGDTNKTSDELVQKIKRRTLNMSEKCDLIRDVETLPHKKKKDIAAKYGIPVNTLSTIYSNREKIMHQCTKHFVNLNMKKIRASSYPDIEEGLINWYVKDFDANNGNNKISGLVLRDKALQLAKSLGHNNFVASNGWIERFKARHNITAKKPHKRKQNDKTSTMKINSVDLFHSNLVWENISNPVMELKEYGETYNCEDFLHQPADKFAKSGTNRQLSNDHVVDSQNSFPFQEIGFCNLPKCRSVPTYQEALDAFSIIFQFVESSEHVPERMLHVLQELQEFLVKEGNSRKQTKITDYFGSS